MSKKLAKKAISPTQTGPSTAEASPAKKATPSPGKANWTFLTNHAHVLILIKNSPDIPLREVALQVGITERAVQRIVHELDVAGYVTITRVGRKNHYWVNEDLHLRHPIEQEQTIGQLINLVGRK